MTDFLVFVLPSGSSTIFLTQVGTDVFFVIALFLVLRLLYRIYLHPLSVFPGPKLAAVTELWYAYHWMSGRFPFQIEKMHMIYGDVVRIAPNELSFASSQSFKDIYGRPSNGRPTFIKGTLYQHPHKEPGIAAERTPEAHRETRRLLSQGFSTKALRDHEEVVREHCDLLVSQIKARSQCCGMLMNDWFYWLSFDIIGDLAYGESFNAVREGKAHHWTDTPRKGVHLVNLLEIGRRLPLLSPFILLSLSKTMKQSFDFFLTYSRQQIRKRVARQCQIHRIDFFAKLLSDSSRTVSEDWLMAQANVLMFAGSDTSATALTTIMFLLTRHEDKLRRLEAEVRKAIPTASDITDSKLRTLPYLTATIEESLRMCPPAALGLPRISPGVEVDGHFIPAGVTVSTSAWTTTHKESDWTDPRAFVPERWLPHDHEHYDSKFRNDNRESAQPFSLGSRGCLGINLAYMEMRHTIAKFVFYFNMSAHPTTNMTDWELEAQFRAFWELPSTVITFQTIQLDNGCVHEG